MGAKRKYTDEDVKRMIELRKSGMTNKQIAKEIGCSEGFVQTYTQRAGLGRPVEDEEPFVYTEPAEICGVPYTMATRKPQVHDVVIKGKKYKDITELVGGI